jgi:hypothetical protein
VQRTWDAIINAPVSLDDVLLAEWIWYATKALMSTAAEYSICYGAVTILDSTTDNFVTIEGQIVPESWIERRPSRRFLQLNSQPLPVPHEVDSWFVAKVL